MGKGKERVLHENFCNRVSERFDKGSKLKRFGFGFYGGIKCIRSGIYGENRALWWRLLVF